MKNVGETSQNPSKVGVSGENLGRKFIHRQCRRLFDVAPNKAAPKAPESSLKLDEAESSITNLLDFSALNITDGSSSSRPQPGSDKDHRHGSKAGLFAQPSSEAKATRSSKPRTQSGKPAGTLAQENTEAAVPWVKKTRTKVIPAASSRQAIQKKEITLQPPRKPVPLIQKSEIKIIRQSDKQVITPKKPSIAQPNKHPARQLKSNLGKKITHAAQKSALTLDKKKSGSNRHLASSSTQGWETKETTQHHIEWDGFSKVIKPLGQDCNLCLSDLAYKPTEADDEQGVVENRSPEVSVLPCGHVYHSFCLKFATLEQLTEPPCFVCASLFS